MNSGVSPVRKRAGWVVALLAAFVGALVMSVTASAVNPNIYDFSNNGAGVGVVPDPQTTNYPGQAAIGQTLRFLFCAPTDVIATSGTGQQTDIDGINPLWTIANWTGDDMPFLVNSGNLAASAQHLPDETCFFVDYGSHKPGLLDLKFFATFTGAATDDDPLVNHHNFLGIWQEIYDVTLSVDETGKLLHKQNPAKYSDPNMAGKDGVPVIAKVRGSFPLGTKAKKGGKSTVILPDDFGWLANQFAVDGTNVSFGGAGAAYRWDIHDDQVINKKTKKDVQHPYCQTFYPWTDGTGYNLYREPPTGNKATSIPHPYYCNPATEKRPTPKVPDFFIYGDDIEACSPATEIVKFNTPPGCVTQGPIFVNPFTTFNMVPWPANDEDSVTNPAAGLAFSDILGRPLPAVNPVGPYDSHRVGNNTAGIQSVYYPNGVTNAGDATAPAWRIDFQIQPNGTAKKAKGKGAIDGAGFLATVDKNLRTHFDKNGDEDVTEAGLEQAEESTGPFHRRQVPALSATQSGVGTTSSPGSAQNSNGYFPGGAGFPTGPIYSFWDLLHTGNIDANRGRSTACTNWFEEIENGLGQIVRRTPGSHDAVPDPDGTGNVIVAQVAPDLAAVYADEHGQGEVQLKPGFGFYFDQLGYKATSQYGCDLQGINTLGTATVIATAHYPDQQSAGAKQVASNPVTKQWKNGFNVQLSYAPKGGNNPGYRVTAWKTDINGNSPVSNPDNENTDNDFQRSEEVCLSVPDGTVSVPQFPLNLFNNTLIPNVEASAPPGFDDGPHLACATMRWRGTDNANVASAFFDVFFATGNGHGQTVYASFVTEQIKRQLTIAKKSGGNPPPVDGNGKPREAWHVPEEGRTDHR